MTNNTRISSHRIALDPTVEQRKKFARACGVSRFAWNWGLAEWNRLREAGKKTTWQDIVKTWNALKGEQFPWVYESPKTANQRPFADLGAAFTRFFNKTAQYPKFKKRNSRDSYYLPNDQIQVEGDRVRIPLCGWVRCHESLRLNGKIMSATVSREADKWFIAVRVEIPDTLKVREANGVTGLDLGLKTAIVDSDGITYESPMSGRCYAGILRRRHKQLARKVPGSANYKDAVRRLGRTIARIKNVKTDWIHKTTTNLVRKNAILAVEDLAVGNLKRNGKISRAVNDVGWGEIVRQLDYKAPLYGSHVVKVDRYAPTSKTCSNCGAVKDSLPLTVRTYVCKHCGNTLDRDHNAAINIRTLGLRGSNACGLEGRSAGATRRSSPRSRQELEKAGRQHVSQTRKQMKDTQPASPNRYALNGALVKRLKFTSLLKTNAPDWENRNRAVACTPQTEERGG